MGSIIKELGRGNIVPQSDSRNNYQEMQQMMEYMARHHEELLKGKKDEEKEILGNIDDCWIEDASYAEEAICHYAFRIGMRIAMVALTRE